MLTLQSMCTSIITMTRLLTVSAGLVIYANFEFNANVWIRKFHALHLLCLYLHWELSTGLRVLSAGMRKTPVASVVLQNACVSRMRAIHAFSSRWVSKLLHNFNFLGLSIGSLAPMGTKVFTNFYQEKPVSFAAICQF